MPQDLSAAKRRARSPTGRDEAKQDDAKQDDARPRERMLRRGAAALTDAELLALVLGTSGRGCGGALATCQRLLARGAGWPALIRAQPSELMSVAGVGRAKACALMAVVEISRRMLAASGAAERALTCSDDVFARIGGRLAWLSQEVFWVLALDARNRVTAEAQVAQGTATAVEIHPRDVFALLVRESAVSGVVAHNHPSGDPEPSDDDLRLTRRLRRAGEVMGIPVVDHLIVGRTGYVSLAQRGLM